MVPSHHVAQVPCPFIVTLCGAYFQSEHVVMCRRLFWQSRCSAQLAKGVAGAQFLTPEKEIQDALVQGLKESKGSTGETKEAYSAGSLSLVSMRAPFYTSECLSAGRVVYNGLHHVGLLVENLERSLDFYVGTLGLELNSARPDNKLPYRGAWLWIGRQALPILCWMLQTYPVHRWCKQHPSHALVRC